MPPPDPLYVAGAFPEGCHTPLVPVPYWPGATSPLGFRPLRFQPHSSSHRDLTLPSTVTVRCVLATYAQKLFVLHTGRPGLAIDKGSSGVRQVTSFGSPSPLGSATVGLSIRVLPSGARSLPFIASFHQS